MCTPETTTIIAGRVLLRDAGIPGAEHLDARGVHLAMTSLQRDAIRLHRDVIHHVAILRRDRELTRPAT